MLFRARRQVHIAGGDFTRAVGDGIRAMAHARHDALQIVIHLFQGPQQQARFIVAARVDGDRQVAGCHPLRHLDGFADGAADRAADQHGQCNGNGRRGDRQGQGQDDGHAPIGGGLLAFAFHQQFLEAGHGRQCSQEFFLRITQLRQQENARRFRFAFL